MHSMLERSSSFTIQGSSDVILTICSSGKSGKLHQHAAICLRLFSEKGFLRKLEIYETLQHRGPLTERHRRRVDQPGSPQDRRAL